MTTETWSVADLPTEGPATLEGVKEQARIPASDTRDDVHLDAVVAAVNGLVRTWPVVRGTTTATGWPGHVVLGATMLAARLFRRRNSPAGVEAFGTEGAVYVQRNDPDVAMLMGLGAYAAPGVG